MEFRFNFFCAFTTRSYQTRRCRQSKCVDSTCVGFPVSSPFLSSPFCQHSMQQTNASPPPCVCVADSAISIRDSSVCFYERSEVRVKFLISNFNLDNSSISHAGAQGDEAWRLWKVKKKTARGNATVECTQLRSYPVVTVITLASSYDSVFCKQVTYYSNINCVCHSIIMKLHDQFNGCQNLSYAKFQENIPQTIRIKRFSSYTRQVLPIWKILELCMINLNLHAKFSIYSACTSRDLCIYIGWDVQIESSKTKTVH